MDNPISAYDAINEGPDEFNSWVKNNPNVKISFSGMDLSGKKFNLSHGRAFLHDIDFSDANLRNASFHYLDIKNCNFEEANLENARFSKAYATGCNFRKANLLKATFHRGKVDDCDFTDANLQDSDFTIKSCKNADMRGARIKGMNIQTTWDGYPWDEWPENLLFAKNLELIHPEGMNDINEYISCMFFNVYNESNDTDFASSDFFKHVTNKINLLTGLYAETNPPESFISTIQHINVELFSRLQQNPNLMHKLHWRAFEELVAELLASFGWHVELTSPTKDNGYDIFAIYKDQSGIRHNWIIECKKFDPSRKVGIDIVRSLYGVKTDLRVGNALLATTSSFTQGVDKFKASRYDLETKNFHDIVEWVKQYKVNDGGLYIKEDPIELLKKPQPRLLD